MTIMPVLGLLPWLLLAPPQSRDEKEDMSGLRSQVRDLENRFRSNQDTLRSGLELIAAQLQELRKDASAPANTFLTSPPPGSGSVGVAKVPVFGPRIAVESASQRHDLVTLLIQRVEVSGNRRIATAFLGSDTESVELPIDQSAALYIVDWSTADGLTYNLILKDGATEQVATTAQVKPMQFEGRFIFVGFRLD
jgi:hypothetical protein